MKTPFVNAKVVTANYPVADYIKDEFERGDKRFVMSRGALMRFAECPSKWIDGVKDDETKSTDWGNLIDCLALTPKDFSSRYAIAPAVYPADGKKKGDPAVEKPWNWNATFCKEWRENQIGKEVITNADYGAAKQAVACLLADEQISAVVKSSDVQVYCTADYIDDWHNDATGLLVPVKILIDLLPDKDGGYQHTIADLKTTESAIPRKWRRSVHDYTYDCQAALQLDIFNLATGEERLDFRHIIQESSLPYQVGKRILTSEFLSLGRMRYLNALAYYCQCLASGVWPDYDSHCPSRDQYEGWQFVSPEDWMVASVPDVPTLVKKVKKPTEEERIDITP